MLRPAVMSFNSTSTLYIIIVHIHPRGFDRSSFQTLLFLRKKTGKEEEQQQKQKKQKQEQEEQEEQEQGEEDEEEEEKEE